MRYIGTFTPLNPQKYKGDYKNITYRSSWEKKVMIWLDKNPNIMSWSSEEVIVPYKSPADGKWHRYFVDFYVQVKTVDGKLKSELWEVKPKKQTAEPQVKKRITKQYINEVVTWSINQAKWAAATDFCNDRGWSFRILTEDHLGL
jgi:hypothetical protein